MLNISHSESQTLFIVHEQNLLSLLPGLHSLDSYPVCTNNKNIYIQFLMSRIRQKLLCQATIKAIFLSYYSFVFPLRFILVFFCACTFFFNHNFISVFKIMIIISLQQSALSSVWLHENDYFKKILFKNLFKYNLFY